MPNPNLSNYGSALSTSSSTYKYNNTTSGIFTPYDPIDYGTPEEVKLEVNESKKISKEKIKLAFVGLRDDLKDPMMAKLII